MQLVKGKKFWVYGARVVYDLIGMLVSLLYTVPVKSFSSEMPQDDYVCSARGKLSCTLFYHFSLVWKTTYLMSALLTKFLKKLSSDSVWCSGKSSMIQVSTIDPLLPKETLQNKCNLSYVQLNITHTQYSNLASNAKMQPKPQVTVVLNSLSKLI